MLFPNVTLYPRTELGERVRIHSGTVIGADGFGYVLDAGVHRKVPQIGNVILGDDVEIGANVTIDRGALSPPSSAGARKSTTSCRSGTTCRSASIASSSRKSASPGSCELGNYVILAGQAGLSGHLKIGNQVTVSAQSGVMHDIPAGEKWLGSPAQPDKQTKRQMLAIQRLPELIRRVAKIEKQLGLGNAPEN